MSKRLSAFLREIKMKPGQKRAAERWQWVLSVFAVECSGFYCKHGVGMLQYEQTDDCSHIVRRRGWFFSGGELWGVYKSLFTKVRRRGLSFSGFEFGRVCKALFTKVQRRGLSFSGGELGGVYKALLAESRCLRGIVFIKSESCF